VVQVTLESSANFAFLDNDKLDAHSAEIAIPQAILNAQHVTLDTDGSANYANNLILNLLKLVQNAKTSFK